MQAGRLAHGLIGTPPPKCRLQFWARWHHVPADCDMSDGTWSRLLVTAVHRVVTFPRSLSVSVPVSSLLSPGPPRGQARIMKGALSISLSIRPGIDNVKSTKPALGSTECCCRFNQAGLLRNDRPPLLRFPKPVPVPALPVVVLAMQVRMPCLVASAVSLSDPAPPVTKPIHPSPIPRQLISQQLAPSLIFDFLAGMTHTRRVLL